MHAPALARRGIPVALWLFVAFLVVRCSWMADDAFITLASVEQFASHGVIGIHFGERLQAYTHPLWFLLLGATRVLGIPAISAAFVWSWTLAAGWIAAVAWMGRRHPWRLTFVALAVLGSRAWIDFATGGLENALASLLFLLFVHALWRPHLRWQACLFATLLLWTRLDHAFVVVPLLLFWLLERPYERVRPATWAFLLPLIMGGLVTAWYFGALLPTSFYAKLASGLPRSDHFMRGAAYVVATFLRDPGTLIVLAFLALRMLYVGGREAVAAMAIVLHALYVIWIGGDFMSGRFFVAPLAVALAVAVHAAPSLLPRGLPARVVVFGSLSLLALFACTKQLRIPGADQSQEEWLAQTPGGRLLWGVADERWLYAYEYGYFSPHVNWPSHSHTEPRLRLVDGGGGRAAFEKGRGTRLIDRVGLLDAFLARQPAIPDPQWRTGHAIRSLPQGYVETLWYGENQLRDPRLASLYDDLAKARRGTLLDGGRLELILRLATFRPPAPEPADRFEPLLDEAVDRPWSGIVELSGPVRLLVLTRTRGMWQLVEGVETIRWSLVREGSLVASGFVGPGRRAPFDAEAGDHLILEPLCPQPDCPRLRVELRAP